MSWGCTRIVAVAALVGTAACASEAGTVLEGPTTSSEPVPRSYDVGTCLTWESNTPTPASDVDPQAVACDAPHRLQITGDAAGPEVAGRFYPTADVWEARIAVACRPPAAELLGGPMDPRGRFGLEAIRPSREEWAAGVTTMWCGVEKGSANLWPGPLTGDARNADQTPRYPGGTCLIGPPASRRLGLVPCDKTHVAEVAGHVTFPDNEEIEASSGDPRRCAATAATYLGGSVAPPWEALTEVIGPSSWEAGRRLAHCFLAQRAEEGGGYKVLTGPARD